MSKSKFFTGQPVFNQLLSLIPTQLITELSKAHCTNRYCKKFGSFEQLVTMLYACFHKCGSLREVITGMQANSHRLQHLGLKSVPRRSTLSDANKRINPGFYRDLYHGLFHQYFRSLPDSRKVKSDKERLFIIDSTTITLFSDIMKGVGNAAGNGRRKGGAKAHVVVEAKHDVPSYIFLSEAKSSDRHFLTQINSLPPGSIVVMDKAYNSYKKYAEWTRNSVTWVTRLNERAACRVIKENPINYFRRRKGIVKDQIIEMGRPDAISRTPVLTVRLILYYDPVNQRHFKFVTNDLTCSPLRIAKLYKERWQIEILFKRLKSSFQFRYFLGDNENAIKTQIWCAFIADLLIKVIKNKLEALVNRRWSFANIAGLIRLHLYTYIDILKFLANPDSALINYKPPEKETQLTLAI